jgi:CIC family chloride channel protein
MKFLKTDSLSGKLNRFKIGEQTIIIVMSVVVGLLSGFANMLFRATMNFVHEVIFIGGSDLLRIAEGGYYKLLLPLLPVCGALLLIPLYYLSREEVYGYGFPGFLEKVNIRGGIIRFKTLIVKILGASFTIGSGGSAGVEGPIAQIGGACGSLVGQISRFSGNRIKLLIAAGSAGAIAATFNAPIAGVMFATEIVLLGNYALTSFAAIVVSSGIALSSWSQNTRLSAPMKYPSIFSLVSSSDWPQSCISGFSLRLKINLMV